jgi:hypothetical protein
MDEPPKCTLTEALEIARAQGKEEPPALWAPGMDQPPPESPIIGQPIPEGVIVHQAAHPHQMKLALKQVERSPDRTQQEAFASHWPAIEANDAVRKSLEEDMKAENLEWGFTKSPESLVHQEQLPEGVYRLDDIVKEPWCKRLYKTKAGLGKFLLQAHRYPSRLTALGLLTRAGFQLLVARRLEDERRKDLGRKEIKAAKQTANQVPEPVDGPTDASPPSLASEITPGK